MDHLPETYWKTNNLLYQREMENKKPLYIMNGTKLKRGQTQDSGWRFYRVVQLPSTKPHPHLDDKALTVPIDNNNNNTNNNININNNYE